MTSPAFGQPLKHGAALRQRSMCVAMFLAHEFPTARCASRYEKSQMATALCEEFMFHKATAYRFINDYLVCKGIAKRLGYHKEAA